MANDFKPTIGGKVLKKDAEAWIKKYDDEKAEKAKDTTSVFFGRDFIENILRTHPEASGISGRDFIENILRTHPEASGISFFLCKKYSEYAGKDVVDLVLVPRKEDGTLIWPYEDGKDGGQAAYDSGKTCPPSC
jgi:hypothetical protein